MISFTVKICFVCLVLSVTLFIIYNIRNSTEETINFGRIKYFGKFEKYLVPNIVHYIIFGNCTLNFLTYVSILSAVKIQKPKKILIHSDQSSCNGKYWEALQKIHSNATIKVSYFARPTHIYGQPISSVYHASDVARIRILQKFGGLYLDTDVVIINNLDSLRSFEIVLGWPEKQYIGNQVILANKNAKFLQLWLEGYKHYHPRNWYYNAGQYPTEIILEQHPELIHRESELLGVHNLLEKLHSQEKWDDWKFYYTIHILARHSNISKNLSENTVENLSTNLHDIISYILNLAI